MHGATMKTGLKAQKFYFMPRFCLCVCMYLRIMSFCFSVQN